MKTASAWLTTTLSAATIAMISGHAAFAGPVDGRVTVTYTVPKARTLDGKDAVMGLHSARVKLIQGDLIARFNFGAPFSFTALEEKDTTLKVEADSNRFAVVTENVTNTPWSASKVFKAPFPNDGGGPKKLLAFDLGNVGALANKAAIPTDEQKLSRAFLTHDILSNLRSSLDGLGGTFGSGEVGADMTALKGLFPSGGTAYSTKTSSMRLMAHDAIDADILGHEYGHGIAHKFKFDDPKIGGKHFAGVDSGSEKLGWGEGIATFMSLWMQQRVAADSPLRNLKHFGDTFYTDTEDSDLHYDAEGNQHGSVGATKALNSKGNNDELSVLRMMWDLLDDTPNEILNDNQDVAKKKKDTVRIPEQHLWKLLTKPATGTKPETMTTFMTNLREALKDYPLEKKAKDSFASAVGELSTDHKISPRIDATPKKKTPGPRSDAFVFEWRLGDDITPDVFVDDEHDDDDIFEAGDTNFRWFRLAIYDQGLNVELGTSEWLDANDAMVSLGRWQYVLDGALLDQVMAGQPDGLIRWFVITETSRYASLPSMLPVIDFPLWSETQFAMIPASGAGALILGVAAMAMRRRRR